MSVSPNTFMKWNNVTDVTEASLQMQGGDWGPGFPCSEEQNEVIHGKCWDPLEFSSKTDHYLLASSKSPKLKVTCVYVCRLVGTEEAWAPNGPGEGRAWRM